MKGDHVWYEKQPEHRTIGKTERDGMIEVTTAPWYCQWVYQGDLRILTVPVGYVWDGASIPRVAWTAIGLTPGGLMDAPSLAHDTLYRAAGGKKPSGWHGCRLTNKNGNVVQVGRAEADWVLREMAEYAGVRRARSAVAYGVVRAFGALHWGGPMPAARKGIVP